MGKKLILFLILFSLILSPYSFGFKGTNVSRAQTTITNQNITSDTTWRLSDSPFIIDYKYVNIFPGITLTIEPGVIVKMSVAGFTVRGNLVAIGTEANPIIFTSNNDSARGGDTNPYGVYPPVAGDWQSINIWDGGYLNLDHAIINYGGGEPQMIYNNLFKSNSALAAGGLPVISANYATIRINNSEISQNNTGLSFYSVDAQIHNSKISANTGIAFSNWSDDSNAPIYVDATNNWWGSDTGPYNFDTNPTGTGGEIQGYVTFDPWTGKAEAKVPVIIVPGIMGSYLVRNNTYEEIWPRISTMLLDPWDQYLNELALQPDGTPAAYNGNLFPADIFKDLYGEDFFAGLIDELKNNGYVENENIFVFPYDWRWPIDWIAGNDPYPNIMNLREKIEDIKQKTGASKVNIIAHSMGGLVAKDYIQNYGQDSVDKFIDIATPHLGSPAAFKTLMYGDNLDINVFGVHILNSNTIYNISQNFSSIYQLLPSKKYFDSNNPDYAYYIYDMFDYDNNGVTGKLNYDESTSFQANSGRNANLLSLNDQLHQNIDNFNPESFGITAYNIIGCGRPTLGQINILNKEKSGGHEYALKYINGDGTVPLRSAENFPSLKTYYNTGTDHSYLPSFSGVRQLVSVLINGEENNFNFSQYPNLRQDKNNCALNGTQISFHSPINLHVYDENDNHMGPNENGDIEFNINDAAYDIIDGNKFVFLPKGQDYRIEGLATDIGTFNARVQNIENGEITETAYYNEVPLDSASASVEIEINNDQANYDISIDQNGDKEFETIKQPSSILNDEDLQDTTSPQTDIIINNIAENDGSNTARVEISFNAQDNEGGSGIFKTEYSLDDQQTWQEYLNPFILERAGVNNIQYMSTDRAGNVETVKKEMVTIDESGPVIDYIIPQSSQEFLRSEKMEILYNLIDDASGVATDTIKLFINEKAISSTTIDLFNYKLGAHLLTIQAADLVGNHSIATTSFLITANIASTISNINRLDSESEIINIKVAGDLKGELGQIQNYIEKYGQKQLKMQEEMENSLKKCLNRKNKSHCEQEIKDHYGLISYKLDQANEKIVNKRLSDLLKDISKYFNKQWITSEGYDIIKEDIIYLINNIS